MLPNFTVVICGAILTVLMLAVTGSGLVAPETHTRVGAMPEVGRPMMQRMIAAPAGQAQFAAFELARRTEELVRLRDIMPTLPVTDLAPPTQQDDTAASATAPLTDSAITGDAAEAPAKSLPRAKSVPPAKSAPPEPVTPAVNADPAMNADATPVTTAELAQAAGAPAQEPLAAPAEITGLSNEPPPMAAGPSEESLEMALETPLAPPTDSAAPAADAPPVMPLLEPTKSTVDAPPVGLSIEPVKAVDQTSAVDPPTSKSAAATSLPVTPSDPPEAAVAASRPVSAEPAPAEPTASAAPVAPIATKPPTIAAVPQAARVWHTPLAARAAGAPESSRLGLTTRLNFRLPKPVKARAKPAGPKLASAAVVARKPVRQVVHHVPRRPLRRAAAPAQASPFGTNTAISGAQFK